MLSWEGFVEKVGAWSERVMEEGDESDDDDRDELTCE